MSRISALIQIDGPREINWRPILQRPWPGVKDDYETKKSVGLKTNARD